jgi:protein required for attachment to host cells
MDKVWVVAAESASARIFTAKGLLGPLTEIDVLVNPEARSHGRDLETERAGRSFDSEGEGRHAMEPSTDPHEQVVIRFARRVADRIEAGRVGGDFDRLVLLAAPRFLGHLRSALGREVRALVVREVAKDPARASAEEIAKLFAR